MVRSESSKSRTALEVLERLRSLVEKHIYERLSELANPRNLPGLVTYLKDYVRTFEKEGKLPSREANRLLARLERI